MWAKNCAGTLQYSTKGSGQKEIEGRRGYGSPKPLSEIDRV